MNKENVQRIRTELQRYKDFGFIWSDAMNDGITESRPGEIWEKASLEHLFFCSQDDLLHQIVVKSLDWMTYQEYFDGNGRYMEIFDKNNYARFNTLVRAMLIPMDIPTFILTLMFRKQGGRVAIPQKAIFQLAGLGQKEPTWDTYDTLLRILLEEGIDYIVNHLFNTGVMDELVEMDQERGKPSSYRFVNDIFEYRANKKEFLKKDKRRGLRW